MRWAEKSEILSYIIDAYQGTERAESNGAQKRQFLWEEADGSLVIGNTRAFTDHVRHKFGLPANDRAWYGVHDALQAVGEVIIHRSAHRNHNVTKTRNQEPEVRIIRRGK